MWLPLVLAMLQSGVISGDYIEDRANKVYGCYCEWSGEGEHGGREAVLGWKVRAGVFRGTDLAGAGAVAVIRGERTLSRGDAPRRSILVIDSRATPAQRRALETLLRENYAALLGEVIQVHAAPVDLNREAGGATLRAGDLLSLNMRRARPVEDSLQGATLWYDPFIPISPATMGTTLHVDYGGDELNLRWSRDEAGITGYYGAFRLTPR